MELLKNLNLGKRWTTILDNYIFVMIFSTVTAGVLIMWEKYQLRFYLALGITTYIGFLASISWSNSMRYFDVKGWVKWLSLCILFACLGYLYFLQPKVDNLVHADVYYYNISIIIGLHLLVGIIPFLFRIGKADMVQYYIDLLLAWVTALLYSLILFLCFSIAMLALDQLFGVNWGYKSYFYLFILIAGIFHPLVFLTEIPLDDTVYQRRPLHALFVKFITWVAIPSVFVFGVIIFLYIIKTLITHEPIVEWAYILCVYFWLAGLITWCCVQLFKDSGNKLLSLYDKWFFIIHVVSILLFIYSLYDNIHRYSLKEEYYAAALILMSAIVLSLYFMLKKNYDYRWIPIVFIGLSIMAVFSGKFSIQSLPVSIQQNKLYNLLEAHGIINNGKIERMQIDNPIENSDDFLNTVYYLSSKSGLDFLTKLDVNELIKEPVVDWLYKIARIEIDTSKSIFLSGTLPSNIKGADCDYILPFRSEKDVNEDCIFYDKEYIYYYSNNKMLASWTLDEIELKKLEKSMPNVLKTQVRMGGYSFEIYFERLETAIKDGKMELLFLDGLVCLKKVN